MIWTILICLGCIIYGIGAGLIFVNGMIVDAFGAAFGWPGSSLLSLIAVALLWPILLPIGWVLDFIDYLRGR